MNKQFNEHTTGLHDAIEDQSERQIAIDTAMVEDAIVGNRGDDQQAIAIEVVRWGALLLRKNKDYGSSVWKPPVLAPECDPGTAIRVRMSDKISRLASLLENDAEVNESIDDTLRDLGAYCLLELARPGRGNESAMQMPAEPPGESELRSAAMAVVSLYSSDGVRDTSTLNRLREILK